MTEPLSSNPDPSLLTEEVFRSFSARLKRFINSRIADASAADDILQDVFLKIHSSIGGLQDKTKVESWIFQITRNAIIDHYRMQGRRGESSLQTEDVELPFERDPVEEIVLAVRGMVMVLPEIYRQALLLTEYDGLTQRELANRLGISLSAAKSRVQRARAMLKELLLNCCHIEFDIYGSVLDYQPNEECLCCSRAR